MPIFISLIAIFAFSQLALSQDAVEQLGANSLDFRGQGATPWCFAFAEEQLLKDLSCSGQQCLNNADEWELSVFDIAKDHRQRSSARFGQESTEVSQLFGGSLLSFPYIIDGVRQFRSADCTLEKAIFRINRDPRLNVFGMGMYQMLEDLYANLKNHGLPDHDYLIRSLEELALSSSNNPDLLANIQFLADQARSAKTAFAEPGMKEAFTVLNTLAAEAESKEQFITRVLNYTICDTKVSLPQGAVKEKLTSDLREIESIISRQLARSSVVVGVCAEALADEVGGKGKCGGHAVALKAQRDHSYLVVDSAFFSHRPKNEDGSAWIPKEIVHLAISKMGKHLEQNRAHYETEMAKLRTEYQDTIAKIRAEYEQTIRQSLEESQFQLQSFVSSYIEFFKKSAAGVSPHEIKARVISVMSQLITVSTGELQPHETEQSRLEDQKARQKLITEVSGLEISSVQDIDQIDPIMMGIFMQRVVEQLERSKPEIFKPHSFDNSGDIRWGSNIIWLE